MKVCLLDMDERTRQSMALVLRHRGDGAIVLSDVGTADIAVLDLDHENAPQAFEQIRARRPALLAIGLTARPGVAHEGIVVLAKPVSAGNLLEAIQKQAGIELPAAKIPAAGAAAALGARTATTRRRPEAPLAHDKKVFDPAAYLLGALLDAAAEAGRRDAVAVISFYGDRVILADPRAGLIRTNLTSSQARGFAHSSLEADTTDPSATVGLQRPRVEYLTRAEADSRYAAQTYPVPQEMFMWSLGAMTSRGRLPADVRADERVYLRRWPNLTRVAHTANEMRIIAYWVRQATSLQEIVAALGVPEREVFSVYTAASAAGLAGRARREVDGIWEAPLVAEPRQRGLFSSILDRLLQRNSARNEETQEAAA
ncbi:MAG TPA: hypothetical protein VKO83_03260 [Steroidobacteraceae bacterium]|nr:hypothetical protein [Steroidobacteraceae bacterium]